MTPILTRFEILLKEGGLIYNTTDHEDLSNLNMPHDKEGFPGRHLNIGTEFTMLPTEQREAGRYRVIDIRTFIEDDSNAGSANSINGSYEWGLHIIYVVERIK